MQNLHTLAVIDSCDGLLQADLIEVITNKSMRYMIWMLRTSGHATVVQLSTYTSKAGAEIESSDRISSEHSESIFVREYEYAKADFCRFPQKSFTILQGKAAVTFSRLDSTLKVWCIQSGRLLQVVLLHSGSGGVTCAAVDKERKIVCIGTEDGTLSKWKITPDAEKSIHTLLDEFGDSASVRVPQASNLGLGISSFEPKASSKFMNKLWGVIPRRSPKLRIPRIIDDTHGPDHWIIGCHSSQVKCVAVSSEFNLIVSYSESRHCVHFYNCNQGHYIRTVDLGKGETVSCLHVCNNSEILIALESSSGAILQVVSINGVFISSVNLEDYGPVRTLYSQAKLNGTERIIAICERSVTVLDDQLNVCQALVQDQLIAHTYMSNDGRLLFIVPQGSNGPRVFVLGKPEK